MSSLLALPPLLPLGKGVVAAGEVGGGGLFVGRRGEVALARREGLTLPLDGPTRWTTWRGTREQHIRGPLLHVWDMHHTSHTCCVVEIFFPSSSLRLASVLASENMLEN